MSPNVVLLLGNRVSHSLSPAMQNAAFAALGVDCSYEAREIDSKQLPSVIAELRRDARILGANVTIPFKQSVIPMLDDLDSLARQIGAVNTISRRGHKLGGWNTDVTGFRCALEECGYDVAGEPVAIIGAGGAARAVAQALRETASRLWLIVRHLDRAQELIHELALDRAVAVPMDDLVEALSRVPVVVNATPADLPPPAAIRVGQRVFDLRSRRSMEGRAMLLHQGAASFELWTGRPAPLDVMRSALDRAAEVVPA